MMRSVIFPLVCVVALPASITCAQSRANTQRGATVGGITGAIIGGIIGENNDEAGAGAVIGGAVGALAGGSLGSARDREIAAYEADRRMQAQKQYYAQQQQQRVTKQAVSLEDVVAMCRSGLSDHVVMTQINERGVQRTLEVSDIIFLHNHGVSETVIAAMQRANVGQPAQRIVQPVAPVPQPVYVEQRYHVVPTYVVPRYYYPHHPPRHHYRPRSPRSGWSFSIGF